MVAKAISLLAPSAVPAVRRGQTTKHMAAGADTRRLSQQRAQKKQRESMRKLLLKQRRSRARHGSGRPREAEGGDPSQAGGGGGKKSQHLNQIPSRRRQDFQARVAE